MARSKSGSRKTPAKKPSPAVGSADAAPVGFSRRWVLAGLIGLHVLLCALLFEPKLHTGGDSAEYLNLAQSVLRIGDGYADSMTPGDPVPHTFYPPLYPMLLAPLLLIFGMNFVVLKLFSIACTAASVAVFASWSRSRVPAVFWLLSCVVFAVTPGVVDYSRWILSEAPYLLFTLVALFFLERDGHDDEIGPAFWLAIAAVLAAYYTRGIGIVFLVAGSVHYLLRRHWPRFIWFNVVGAGLSLPWFIRNRVLSGEATPYLEQFLLKSVYEPELGYHDVWGLIGRVLDNVVIYSSRELPRVWAGSDSVWSSHVALKAFSVILVGFMLLGWARALWVRRGAAELYFALSLLALLLFEEVVSDVRYLVPLVPLVLVYAVDGLHRFGVWLSESLPRLARLPASAMLVALVAIGVLAQLQRVPGNVSMMRRYAAGDSMAGYPAAWRSFFEASDWIAANTPGDAVVTVRKPRLFYLWTGRKNVLYPYSTNTDSVLSVVLDTDYVLIDQISGTTGRYLVPAVQSRPERFRVIHEQGRPTSWVLRVLPDPEGT